jgi:cation:H+ antiporter
MTIALLLVGLALLLLGGGALVSGASSLANRWGVSPLVIGLTIVAFGTSAPELVVNILGALRNQTALAFGNVVGSNLANIGLVLGAAALVKPVTIQSQIVRRELPLLMLVTCILAVMTLDRVLHGGEPVLTRSDGLILLLLFSIFGYIAVGDFLGGDEDALLNDVREIEGSIPRHDAEHARWDWVRVVGGLVALSFGGHLTIQHGSALATDLGVSPVIIGLLVVAIGTSLPELVTSIIAAMRNEADLCVGSVIGSNIFNSLFVLPVSALVRPLPIPAFITVDVFVSLAFAAALLPIFFWRGARMGRVAGAIFITSYVAYMAYRVGV